MSDVRLHQLSKKFSSRTAEHIALNELSLHVNDGELLVLVGPSGCGKSTTLRLIAGLDEPTSGHIEIAGRDVAGVSARDRDVAMVFQHYALYPHLTVFDNMAFGLKMRGASRAEARSMVTNAAALLGISPLLDRKPGTLSGGEQQRVAVGRAMVRRPGVFLFDEPLAGLDARLRLQARSEIKSLHRRLGATMVYVTHDQEEAMVLGDRIAVLRRGVLQQCAAPRTVYHQPANCFVAGFVGSPPMSFLSGRVEQAGEGAIFEGSAGRVPLHGTVRYTGDALLGIRAGDLAVRGLDEVAAQARNDSDRAVRLKDCIVDHVEVLGDRVDVHVATITGERLIGRVPPGAVARPGDSVAVAVHAKEVHVFEAGDAGRRLN